MPEENKTGNDSNHFDVFVIGGGINGAGIAREASAAGYKVCLCDAGDFGGGTSSASTKLIHGGLRYLEHYEFRLVREALKEREVLWEMAPHIIRPMRFVLPHHSGLRPKWLLRLGLFLYDHIGGRKRLPPAKSIDLRRDEAGKPLKSEYVHAFEYSDCWVEDSRLVIVNLRDAQGMGASIHPRTEVTHAEYDGSVWKLRLVRGQKNQTVTASVVINAAGPWVDEVLRQVFGINDARNVRLVKGSHIVIPKKFEHDRAYIFQNEDERVVFAIPYEKDFTLIGTTDVEQETLSDTVRISEDEIDYLCDAASEYFREDVKKTDVVWTYSGVRPLYDDGASKAQEATRDYVVRTETTVGNDTLINVFGGKITTFRKLALHIVSEIKSRINPGNVPQEIPSRFCGGNFGISELENVISKFETKYAFASDKMIRRLVNFYGTDAERILGSANNKHDLGKHFGLDLFEAEIRFLMKHEWAMTADDVLFRRTKLGIQMSSKEKTALETWMKKNAIVEISK